MNDKSPGPDAEPATEPVTEPVTEPGVVPPAAAQALAAAITPSGDLGPATSVDQNGVCLVVGASRGIGLALVENLLADPAVNRVIATHRPGSNTDRLRALALFRPTKLMTLPLDVSNDMSLATFAQSLGQIDGGIDLAIHAAGILHEQDIEPEKSLEQCNPRSLMRLFEVNSIGPLMVARALLPHQQRQRRFVFAALSALVGSIADNRLGGWYGYRASKTALNQFVRTLSNECRLRHPRATLVAVHPGTTDTDLSRPFQHGVRPDKLFTPQQTAERILAVLRRLEPRDSGSFYHWDGSEIPW